MRRQPSKQALKLAHTLIERPEIVGFLFAKASTMRYTIAAAKTQEAFPDAGVTEHYAREILRRAHPFDQHSMFIKVDDDHKQAVTSKFTGAVRGPNKPRLQEEACPCTDTTILHEVLDARLVYQTALNKAIDAGMKEESVIAWCDVVARGDLR